MTNVKKDGLITSMSDDVQLNEYHVTVRTSALDES